MEVRKKAFCLGESFSRFMKFSPLLFLAFFFLGVSSCGVFHATSGAGKFPKKRSVSYVQKRLNKNRINPVWVSAKIRLSVETPEQHFKLVSYLRMKRDSAIWMNFKKFGIEAGRLLITPDSAFFINRLERTYFAERLTDLAQAYSLPVDFEQLQALLLGYPVLSEEEVEMQRLPGTYKLVETRSDFSDTLHLDATSFLPRTWSVEHFSSGLQASMDFENYQKFDRNRFFSYFRSLETFEKAETQLKLKLQFEKVELDVPLSLPFVIPERYERIR